MNIYFLVCATVVFALILAGFTDRGQAIYGGILTAAFFIAGFLLACGLILGGLYAWGLQIYVYARTGQWTEYSAAQALYGLTEWGWLATPRDWLGVHRLFVWTSAGFAGVVAGSVAMLFLAYTLNDLAKYYRAKKMATPE